MQRFITLGLLTLVLLQTSCDGEVESTSSPDDRPAEGENEPVVDKTGEIPQQPEELEVNWPPSEMSELTYYSTSPPQTPCGSPHQNPVVVPDPMCDGLYEVCRLIYTEDTKVILARVTGLTYNVETYNSSDECVRPRKQLIEFELDDVVDVYSGPSVTDQTIRSVYREGNSIGPDSPMSSLRYVLIGATRAGNRWFAHSIVGIIPEEFEGQTPWTEWEPNTYVFSLYPTNMPDLASSVSECVTPEIEDKVNHFRTFYERCTISEFTEIDRVRF